MKLFRSVARDTLNAIGKSQAVIEFQLDGTIIDANDNFLKTLGYTIDEVRGKHHSMFVEPGYRDSAEYRNFWESLRQGTFQVAEFRRIGKGGREVWIQASYNPVAGGNGKPYRVVKFATDITEAKLRNAEFEGQLKAINKAQAVIQFNLDGTVIDANENFLNALGYCLEEIHGKHHSMFVEPAYRDSATTSSSGLHFGADNFNRPSISGLARVERRSGFRPPTIRSSTPAASRSRS